MTLPASRERAIPCTFSMKLSEIERAKNHATKRRLTISELIRELIAKDIAEEEQPAA